MVVVEGSKASACKSCAGESSCSTLGAWNARILRLKIPNTLHANVGDDVVIEVPDNAVLRMAFHLYGMPMIALFFGAGIGAWLADVLGWVVDISSAGIGIIAVLLAYWWQAKHHQRTGSNHFEVRMIERIPSK